MSFEARRLRVQLPDGSKVLFVGPDDPEAGAVEHTLVDQPEKIIVGQCIDQFSWVLGSCLDKFTWYLATQPGSGLLSGLSAEDLPVLREHLEGQLSRLDEAERAMRSGPAE
jgi:hypothetical protein